MDDHVSGVVDGKYYHYNHTGVTTPGSLVCSDPVCCPVTPVPAPPAPRHPSSQRFHDLLAELGRLHDQKQADYGRANDPFANVRASEDFGITGWVGALIRANDKMRRLQKAASEGTLANEGIIDSLNDLAVYAMIARVLYEKATP